MNDKTPLIFVYGTLRRSCSSGASQQYLNNTTFLGFARLQANLFRVSHYPAVTLTHDNRTVVGEVYRLSDPDQLLALDDYEECAQPWHPQQEYRREQVSVTLQGSGEIISAWTYIYNLPTANLELIESGDFLEESLHAWQE